MGVLLGKEDAAGLQHVRCGLGKDGGVILGPEAAVAKDEVPGVEQADAESEPDGSRCSRHSARSRRRARLYPLSSRAIRFHVLHAYLHPLFSHAIGLPLLAPPRAISTAHR